MNKILNQLQNNMSVRSWSFLIRFISLKGIDTFEDIKNIDAKDLVGKFGKRITINTMKEIDKAYKKVFNIGFANLYTYNGVIMVNL